jgi:hypothetical protein
VQQEYERSIPVSGLNRMEANTIRVHQVMLQGMSFGHGPRPRRG